MNIVNLQKTKEALDKLVVEKRATRLLEQLDLNIALLSELPKEITNELKPLIQDLIDSNNKQITDSIEQMTKKIVEEIKSITIQAPNVSVNVPDVIVPNVSIPEIKIPDIKIPDKDMTETNKLLKELLNKETPEVDLTETNKLLKDLLKSQDVELEIT